MNSQPSYKVIDPSTWVRQKQFEFFKGYDTPCFNVTVPIDVTRLIQYCKGRGLSFFLTSLHSVLLAINRIVALRLRLEDDEIRLYQSIDGGCTIFNDDETFTFCYFDHTDDIELFNKKGKENVAQVRNTDYFKARDNDLDLIHCSSLPWISFSSFSHARDSKKNQSIPKIIFGKYQEREGKMMMPLSIEVMHCLVDGYHIGLFYQEVNKYIAALTI